MKIKVKVIRKFRDKYTGEKYVRGDLLEVDEHRYSELIAAGNFVFRIEQDASEIDSDNDVINESSENEEAAETLSESVSDGLEEMTVRELKEYADKTYKLTFGNGVKKAEIIEKLRQMERSAKEEK